MVINCKSHAQQQLAYGQKNEGMRRVALWRRSWPSPTTYRTSQRQNRAGTTGRTPTGLSRPSDSDGMRCISGSGPTFPQRRATPRWRLQERTCLVPDVTAVVWWCPEGRWHAAYDGCDLSDSIATSTYDANGSGDESLSPETIRARSKCWLSFERIAIHCWHPSELQFDAPSGILLSPPKCRSGYIVETLISFSRLLTTRYTLQHSQIIARCSIITSTFLWQTLVRRMLRIPEPFII